MKSLKRLLWSLFDGLALILSYGLNFRILSYSWRFWNRIYSYALRRNFKRAGNNLSIEFPAIINGSQNIQIGENFQSFARLRLETIDKYENDFYYPELIIGNNVSINYDCHIGCINKIIIGDNVLMGSKILIVDHFHGEISANDLQTPPARRKIVSKGPIIIEDNVWIGEGAAIMSNVRIGRNSIVGANSVVTHSVPSNCVAGGVPAKVILYLSEGAR